MNGGLPSSRCSHRSRHDSPTTAGSGGQALMASIVEAQESMRRGEQAAAHVVDVVGVAVVGRAVGDDRLQRGRAAGGDLERVEAAPGDPEHARRPRCTRAGRRARRAPRPRPPAPGAGTRPAAHPRSCRCRACPPAPRRSRGRRSTRGAWSRRPRSSHSPGRGCTRAAPAPARSPRCPAARSSRPAGSRRTWGSRRGRSPCGYAGSPS